jgi:hypothetical protein
MKRLSLILNRSQVTVVDALLVITYMNIATCCSTPTVLESFKKPPSLNHEQKDIKVSFCILRTEYIRLWLPQSSKSRR